MHQVKLYFGSIHVAPFLKATPKLSPATRRKLLQMLQNPGVLAHIQVELATVASPEVLPHVHVAVAYVRRFLCSQKQ